MTTEKKPETPSTPAKVSNKEVFAPLGKYAVIAVVMVSIIVTTAVMLNKQLDSVDSEIAALEKKSAETYNTAQGSTADNTTSLATAEGTEINADVNAAVQTETVVTEAETAQTTVATPSAEVLVVQNVTTPAVTTEASQNTAESKQAAQFEMTTTQVATQVATPEATTTAFSQKVSAHRSAVIARQAQLAQRNQARIETLRAEQKENLSEMFTRIAALEATQLERFKANQDEQINRLREQVSQQQQMIETLVLRNKDVLELRTSNVERKQTNREQILNRI